MKRVLTIVSTLALISATFVSANYSCGKDVPQDIIETKKIPCILTYADLSKLYSYKQEQRKSDEIDISYIDAQLLLKIARQEGGPTLDGQLWSMRTILNRVCDNSFDDTVWGVVSAPTQFEVFTDGSYINADVNSNSHIALAMIEGGWDETQGALYWRTDKDSEGSWHDKNLQYIATIEGNRYYK